MNNGYYGEIVEGNEFIGRNEPEGIPFNTSGFDFDLLQSGLSEQMVPQSALSSVSREINCKTRISLFINSVRYAKSSDDGT